MKKFFSCLILLIILINLSACIPSTKKHIASDTKIKLGIIETTGYKNQSYIHFFDENLNFLYREENQYASLSEPFDYPIFKNGDLFTIPKGEFEKRKETCILKYDIQADTYKEFDVGLRSMNRLAVSENYVFGVNTINGISTIARCSINSSSPNLYSKTFTGIYIQEIVVLEDELYAILSSDEQELYLAKFSKDSLEVLEKYDISQYGSPCNLVEFEGKIYISNQYRDALTAELSSLITIFDKNTKTFSQIDLQENSPNNLLVMQDALFVSHFDRVQAQGNKVSIINLRTNGCETHTLNHPVKQIATDGNYLYVLGDKIIYKYVYKNEGLIEVNHKEMTKNSSQTFFYVTSFFLCN